MTKRKHIHRMLVAAALAACSLPALAAIATKPLFLVTAAKPRVMLAMSVDHQLFKKAYPDYNDLNNDGVVDTTYTDTFDYDGYFASDRCYKYDAGQFKPRGVADGVNGHDCDETDEWSGNFLNWATMTRMDVLRKALYGGRRSTDTASATVLERALLPNDVHAFVKVYNPGSGDELKRFAASTSSTGISLCNVTPNPSLSGSDDETQKLSRDSYPPKVRVAAGSYPLWAADEETQCNTGTDSSPASAGVTDYNVRVSVCVAGKLEANCTSYGASYKPTGVLQQYGEDGTIKFGMVSGSYGSNHAGGLLRRALGDLGGNGDSSDEIDTSDGTWAKTAGTRNAGIISTLDNIRINRWDYSKKKYQDCNTYQIPKGSKATDDSGFLSPDKDYRRSGTTYDAGCSNWGNPVAELYLETLRYLSGDDYADGTSATRSSSYAIGNYGYEGSGHLELPNITTWTDPLSEAEWCAPLNVLLISSSDNSFDTDDLTGVPAALGTISTSVDQIGTLEGIDGDVFAGRSGDDTDDAAFPDYCTAKTFTDLSSIKGICPTAPALEGGYHVAGLAFKAHVTDLRPNLTGSQTTDTFVVALAKELPEFSFKVGDKNVIVVPSCRAAPGGTAVSDRSAWAPCTLTDLVVRETEVVSKKLVYARFLASWEDSLWGNDYDKDGISQIAICVGTACADHDDDSDGASDDNYDSDGDGSNDATVEPQQVRVTVRPVNAAAGVSLLFGYSISGTTDDQLREEVLRPKASGSQNILGSDGDIDPGIAINGDWDWDDPDVHVYDAGTTAATLLPNPLIYAAKYGGFTDTDNNSKPNLTAEWDSDEDGQPDNYFFADNPGLLGAKLAEFFGTIDTTSSSASVVANAAVLDANTRIYQAQFNSEGWFGHLYSFPVTRSNGQLQAAEWDAATKITAQDPSIGRHIITWRPAIDTGAMEDRVSASGVAFVWDASSQTYMNDVQKALLDADGNGADVVSWMRGNTVSGLRTRYEDVNGSAVRNVLGDIVHSTPALVTQPDFNYPDSIEADAAYSTFKAGFASSPRTTMLYVGANDGMLHAIDATPGDGTGGTEKFAYVPNAVLANLPALASTDYDHGYYVDGPPTVVDAYLSTQWRTVLVAGLGGGGKAIYALDVTDPSTFSQANAANIVLWELGAADLSGLGYTFSQPAVFKEQGSGKWVAAFGNGYGGTGAKLYIRDLADGSEVSTITLDATAGNGLTTIAPVDTNGDGLVDLIYAGDLKGNVHRLKAGSGGFDSGTGKSNSVLYVAKDEDGELQPITTRLEVGVHPFSNTGRMVYVGTGTYYQTTDNEPGGQKNTMYGLWDQDDGEAITTVSTRNDTVLQEQEIIATQTLSGVETRVISDNSIDWGSQRGWYLDLPTNGERMATEMVLRGGRLIFVTVIPFSATCDAGGDSWLLEINAATGGRLYVTVFDIDGDGSFDQDDLANVTEGDTTTKLPVSGRKFDSIVQSPSIIRAGKGGAEHGGNKEYKYMSSSDGSIKQVTESASVPFGRTSWLQLK